jgi:O-antigen/teichoic acid export membrane protein
MDGRRVGRRTLQALLAQGTAVLMGLVMSLALPKVLSLNGFAYWQLFLFFDMYVGFFHFGLNDGVALIYAGMPLDRNDFRRIASQFWFGLGLQLTLAILVASATMATLHDDPSRRFVLVSAAVYMVLSNATLFVGYVFQAMDETQRYSALLVIEKTVFLGAGVILLSGGVADFRPYAIAYMGAKGATLIYALIRGRHIVFHRPLPFAQTARSVWESVRVGVLLMVSNTASLLVLGVGRFAIEREWGIEAFGQVSLAFSVVNLFVLFVSQFGMVLFPALRKESSQSQAHLYTLLKELIEVVSPLVYMLFFVVRPILDYWLPKYSDSLVYLGALLPICVFNAKNSVLNTTYLKVVRREKQLLAVNLATLALSVAMTLVAVYGLHSITWTILALVLSTGLRGVALELLIDRLFSLRHSYEAAKELALGVLVILAIFKAPDAVALAVVSALCVGYLTLSQRKVRHVARLVSRAAGRRHD